MISSLSPAVSAAMRTRPRLRKSRRRSLRQKGKDRMVGKITNRKALACAAIFSIVIGFPLGTYADPEPQSAPKSYPPETRSLAVSGAGTESCASWTQAREGTSDESKRDSQRRIEWVLGFLTAVNMFTERSGSLHGGIDDREGTFSWIDTRCRAKPNDPLFAAVAELVFDLRNHPRP
jgi:hypothetical protein